MRSDNKDATMKLNRFLSRWYVMLVIFLLLDLTLFFIFTYIINSGAQLGAFFHDKENPWNYLGIQNFVPHILQAGSFVQYLYGVGAIALLVLNGCMAYQIRTALSDSINTGQKGTARWTTIQEIKKQYKAVPLSGRTYRGRAGIVISRIGKKLYVDDSVSNTLVLGTTRSGKGEMYVFPSIDVYSRARHIADRPSMIIADPKTELFKSSKKTLEDRGYIVRLFNLDDPYHSMGYNPLQLVIDHYKADRPDKAQMAAKTFAFSIFHAAEDTQEPIWKNTATDLFTALIIAITTDCLEADQCLNAEREKLFYQKVAAYCNLSDEEKQWEKHFYYQEKERIIDLFKNGTYKLEDDPVLDSRVLFIPDTEEFEEIRPHEKEINCFSCLNFFKELCDRVSMQAGSDQNAFERKAETALDDYFNMRGKLDYAAILYSEIKTAGERTKGSVYINMQSAVSTFSLTNIAQMTAENTISIKELGYGDRPIAIFLATPSEDRSNHFLMTTFIGQVYQYLFQLTKTGDTGTGHLKRNLKFILDEFGNFPRIENFGGFVTVCLGVGISFDLYVQSYSQLHSIYKEEAKTILENCANQIYIMSIQNESAETFAKMLSTKTCIDLQRTGTKLGLEKTFMESATEKPLMHAYDLNRLREGECVICRGMKRTDCLKTAIESHPIINEYADPPGILRKLIAMISVLNKRKIRRDRLPHPIEDRETTTLEEWKIKLNWDQWRRGNALFYRYQYLKADFPDPDTIKLSDVNKESRKHIDIENWVYDPERAIEHIKRQRQKKEKKYMHDLQRYPKIDRILQKALGGNYQEAYQLNEMDTPAAFIKTMEQIQELKAEEKQRIKKMIQLERKGSQ